ncbi:hypothetical protein [Paraburkholderia tuberum]|uniref:hypothetical protein n=1 Tax=Paraburkholderia TaxID=1822464 RepID=UPI00068443DC|nr:RHH-type rel operon transcriptional repressor/antitoxin RelB [Paraburkholderia sp. WSM4179]
MVAVRVNPQIEQRLRLLAELTGRGQSFFLQQMIEVGIGAIEDAWLPPDVLSQVRSGSMPSRQPATEAIPDLFDSALPSDMNLIEGSILRRKSRQMLPGRAAVLN